MSIVAALAKLLAAVDRPGDFYASGRAELPLPRIEVVGIGTIALPVLPAQAKALIEAASRAPYGRGAETVVDTNVRRTWQIDADRVHIGGKHWAETLAAIVARVAEGLGVGDAVSAELYKLLIYDEGSFFVGHRDTEKAPGMVATLVLALPSQSEGGALVVRHHEREARLDLASDDPSEIAFAAFYADCVHEVLPVTKGCRVTLIFNLLRKGKGAAPAPPSYEAEARELAALLGQWSRARSVAAADRFTDVDDWPLKIVYPLQHAYTPAELGFDTLKGVDAAVARLLTTAAPQVGVDLHLALLKVWESGSAEHIGRASWHYRRGRRDADEDADEFEIGEVLDSGRTLSEWRRHDGAPTALAELPVEDDEAAPPGALDNMEPDEEHFHEATGNEGASFDRTYSRAALVMWPTSGLLAVINQAGLGATLPYLEHLAERCRWERAEAQARLRAEAHELAGHMLATWPDGTRLASVSSGWWDVGDDAEQDAEDAFDTGDDIDEGRTGSPIARVIAALSDLGDRERLLVAFDRLMLQQRHEKADNAAILGGLARLPAEQGAALLRRIVAANALDAPGACAELLRLASTRLFARQPMQLLDAATTLVDMLPGDPASAPMDRWGRLRVATTDAALVADLAAVVDRLDAGLAVRAARHVLAWPRHFDPDKVLVPAMKGMAAKGRTSGPAADALHAAAVAHLEARIALALEAPRDWARQSETVGCKCAHCRDLAAFLADPLRETWTLRAAQPHRTHVENEIRRARADVNYRTERKGSPHSLICRKNQASYERRVKQRKQDLADLAALS
jgi:predicted 2-oxoglutarate/Fe(II)-dependent dioxygenase YbiX